MDFGDVIKEMKAHPEKRFARKGWNGRGMFIYLVKGSKVPVENWKPASGVTRYDESNGFVIVNPHIDMYTVNGTRVIGWLASQTDMLADDWMEV